jgi:hypothetical protein
MPRLALSLLLLGSLACGPSGSSQPAPSASTGPLEAGPGVREILGGLSKGDTLGKVQVAFVGAVSQGHIPIQLRKGDATGKILISKLEGSSALPPVKTKKYALYFASQHPNTTPLAQGDLEAACEALAERIRANEDKTTVPAGLTGYGDVVQPL